MNKAPKLSLSARIATAVFALAATFAVADGVDALSAHYVKQGAAAQQVSAAHAGTRHA